MYDTVCPVGWSPVCQRLLDYIVYLFILMQSGGARLGNSALLIPNRAPRHPPRLGGVTIILRINENLKGKIEKGYVNLINIWIY